MSVAALAWAKRQRAGGVAAKAVLLVLADYADDTGLCWPSQDTMASETELSDRSVRDQLVKLEDAGLITRELYRRRDGTRGADRIRLALSDTRNVSPDTRNEMPVDTRNVVPQHPEPRSALTTFEPPLEPSAIVAKATPASYPPEFEEAWKAYPHVKGRSSKPKSYAEWRRMSASDRQGLPAASGRYRREGREPKMDCGAPAMDRWLKDGRYLDWMAGPDPAKAATPEVLAWRREHFRETGEWRSEWGDRP